MFKKEEDFVSNIKPNKQISSQFVAQNKEIRVSQTGTRYIELIISDKTGDIVGRYFSNGAVDEIYNNINLGDVYSISGRTSEFPKGSGKVNIIINNVAKVLKEDYNQDDFLKISKKNKQDLLLEIKETIKNMENDSLKNLLNSFFNDESFLVKFNNAPAARYYHHNYLGGLLEHTVNVLKLCKKVSEIFQDLNEDLLYTGAILHDIGKIDVYDYKLGTILYSQKGNLLDHLFISADMVKIKMDATNFPEKLKDQILHMILSHHGDVKNGWGSAVTPKTAEAIALHHADNLDAKVKGFLQKQMG
jgi:3'-5' exoribonuclease